MSGEFPITGELPEELPGTEKRIASVLRSSGVRSTLAEQAGNNELTSRRELAFSSEVLAEHLGVDHSPEEDAAFFDTRPISEAIILEKVRPVLFIRNGLVDVADLAEVEERLKPIRSKLVKPLSAIGRIELSDHDTYEWCGTGWRVEEDLIITNRHVANVFAEREGLHFRFRLNGAGKRVRANIDFREEYKGVESEEYGIAEILWIAEDTAGAPDIAILRVVRNPGLPEPLSLSRRRVESRQPIAVVGYPARDSRNEAGIMANLFQDVYDVKRFSPGEVVTVGRGAWYLTHDCSTLGGNSGSAVLDLASREVIGLHFGGSFHKTNYAVKASVIKSLLRLRFWMVAKPKSLSVPTEAFSEKRRTKASLAGRKGYQANFLKKSVPAPRPGSSHTVQPTGTTKNLLAYTHFSIVMSASRRFPIYTAENLDGSLKIKLKRKDSWGYDPRIPESVQVGHDEFYGPEEFDKGHMVRRENAGWGTSQEEAQLGEDDSFVYTNAIPQMPQLNQRTWLSLEDYVLDNARTLGFKVNVFTGPIFREDDPHYSGVQVPVDFWKVVVALDAESGKLLTSAYLLSQEGLMPEEGFRFGAFKTYQVPLKRIEELADLRFTKAVRDSDVFRADEIREMVASGRYVEIDSPEDIILTTDRL